MEQTPTTQPIPQQYDKPTQLVKDGIDNNAKDSPRISIDPDSQKMAVVGDPNNVKPTRGDYKLTFLYPEDEVSVGDKELMTYREATHEYAATVTYSAKRVKPLYRSKVVLLLSRIFADTEVFEKDGYTTEYLQNHIGGVLVEHIEDIAEIARMTLGVPREQVEYMDEESLAGFINQFLENEPNIMAEAANFLLSSSAKTRKAVEAKIERENSKQNTAQN